jgi:hypothetical protein
MRSRMIMAALSVDHSRKPARSPDLEGVNHTFVVEDANGDVSPVGAPQRRRDAPGGRRTRVRKDD